MAAWPRPALSLWAQAGLLLAIVAQRAVAEFAEYGGTPFPWDPPPRLVRTGPYAYLANPTLIFEVWKGGMSFHGGFIGVMLAALWFGKRNNKSFFELMDFVAPLMPIGLGAGRIGNFINAELWGKVTDVPWAMVFPNGGPDPRHPSQLYQFALEGVALFVILWLYSRKPRPTMAVSGLFAICYGIFRFIVEFVRVPDAQLGYLAWNWLTMGQVLCLPMILGGIGLMVWAYRRQAAA